MGKSYYHKPQKLGKVFEPGKLQGYFNDLTAKTLWTGEVDEGGVPVDVTYGGIRFQFPILIAQKALGHWDRWLMENNEKDNNEFLNLCDWLLKNQDGNAGWDTWGPFGVPERHRYSAMAQGQALSVLSRAWKLTGDSRYERGAARAIELFLVPVQKAGVTYFKEDEVFLEESPSEPRNTILNGWIFALFGLYDYNLIRDDAEVTRFFEQSVNTLVQHLTDYDNGYWSYYDCQRCLASPFYHSLHISQLEALMLVRPEPIFGEYHRRWSAYQDSLINSSRAFIVKACQKLHEPDAVNFAK